MAYYQMSEHSWCQRGPQRALKLAASLLVAPVVLALSLTSAAAAAQTSARTAAPLPCSATVTNRYPLDGTSVGIRISTSPSVRVSVAAHFEGKTHTKTGRADRSGKTTIWYPVGNAKTGYRVRVDVTLFHFSRRGSCSTWFTPRRRHHHGGGGGGGGGAWCTASASVYYAPYDENNIYVNSNQPYTDATATADGYSWSYETNGNGYAVIYLNGPPQGAAVTVTVGPATCYTSIP